MSEPLSEQIAAFREAIVNWREGVELTPEALAVFDEMFAGWEMAAQALERPAGALADDLEDVEGICADISDEIKALWALTSKINATAARLRALPSPHLKVV
jgi:hypothetical protein